MANLKRQRALEAERSCMAKEEALAWALVREEHRFVATEEAVACRLWLCDGSVRKAGARQRKKP